MERVVTNFEMEKTLSLKTTRRERKTRPVSITIDGQSDSCCSQEKYRALIEIPFFFLYFRVATKESKDNQMSEETCNPGFV